MRLWWCYQCQQSRKIDWICSLLVLASLASSCRTVDGASRFGGRSLRAFFSSARRNDSIINKHCRLFWKDATNNYDVHEAAWNKDYILTCRGGSDTESDKPSTADDSNDATVEESVGGASSSKLESFHNVTSTNENIPGNSTTTSKSEAISKAENQPIQKLSERRERLRIRHTSDMLQELVARSAVVIPESVNLRQLITQRSQDYVQDLLTKRDQQQHQQQIMKPQQKSKLPHPKKLLHYLAPKIPAIKHSPDVNLRIQTARSDIDSGVAACLIGTLARACEMYDTEVLLQNRRRQEINQLQSSSSSSGSSSSSSNQDTSPPSAAVDLLQDRRLEQLVECLMCGVDVKKRKREYLSQFLEAKRRNDNEDSNSLNNGESDEIEELIEGEQVQVQEGLNIRDSCRAAWGLAILGAHHCGTLGGTRVMDLLMALSLRVRELLLSRLQLFFQGDIMEEITELPAGDSTTHHVHQQQHHQSPEERLDDLAEELAEDAAAAMWAFACVRACTGMRSDPLFETCCSILCRDPVELRRRAQQADKDSAIEANDLVDRLLLSEAQIAEAENLEAPTFATVPLAADSVGSESLPAHKTTTGTEDKEALIDWLSPNELTDVLWSLALHGHSEANLREEKVLSENADALKEIAFDRLMELLREDFEFLENQEAVESDDGDSGLWPSTEEFVVTNEGETMTVEVVDAAALLASENAAKTAVVASVENMTIKTSSLGGGLLSKIKEIEVVDAATILRQSGEDIIEQREITASSREGLVHQNDEQTTQLAAIFSDSEDSMISTIPSSDSQPVEFTEEQSDGLDAISRLQLGISSLTDHLYFSPHDLCSLAWAVTELRDSLRFQIVDLVVNILAKLGEESFDSLAGADLSNLAWAIARQSCDARPWTSEADNPSSLQLALWVVRRALIASGSNYGEPVFSHNIHVLDPFQPPELSRLMWAVASLIRSYADKGEDHYPDIEELAMNALVAASNNLSMFSPEDLLRILWSFFELSDMEDALSQPGVADALGRVFASIETSIIRWERGHLSQKTDEDEVEESRGGFNALTALFLRPRLSRQILDQIIEEYNDHEAEDERMLSSIVDDKRSKLPRLRDLSIDPATLAKAAGGFARVTADHSNMRGSPILTRVILKLLTSKNGRLLHEFSMTNLIRACEAAAINEAVGRGEDLVVGQFVRRFLQLLNDANDPERSINGSNNIKSDLMLSTASPEEISTLIWSLGELGARHVLHDKDAQSAHRKLRLVVGSPILTDDQLQHISKASALKLLRGLVALNEMRCDKSILVKVLNLIEPTIPSMWRESDLCELVESLAVIRHSLSRESPNVQIDGHAYNKTQAKRLEEVPLGNDSNATSGIDVVPKNETGSVLESGNTTDSSDNSTAGLDPVVSDYDGLQDICTRMLTNLAVHATDRVSNLKAGSLCRLLASYSFLPFQADNFIDACEEEVSKRQVLLEAAACTASVEDLLRQAAKTAIAANKTVFGKNEDDNDFSIAALKKGLKSIFSADNNNQDDEISEEMQKFTEEVGGLLNRVTAAVTKVDECMEQIGTASNVHTDTALQRIMEGANFELGRCRELIDNYRRINFSTGRRQSRFDYDRQRHIGKRLLSRLIPR